MYHRYTAQHNHDIADINVGFDTRERQDTLVAFIRTFTSDLQPLAQHNHGKRHCKQASVFNHSPEAVIDQPADEGQVILQVVVGVERHLFSPRYLVALTNSIISSKRIIRVSIRRTCLCSGDELLSLWRALSFNQAATSTL